MGKVAKKITPIELEGFDMFPDTQMKLERISNTERAFFMGNAPFVGEIVKKKGNERPNLIYHG